MGNKQNQRLDAFWFRDDDGYTAIRVEAPGLHEADQEVIYYMYDGVDIPKVYLTDPVRVEHNGDTVHHIVDVADIKTANLLMDAKLSNGRKVADYYRPGETAPTCNTCGQPATGICGYCRDCSRDEV